MFHLDTLGNVLTCALTLFALIYVPIKLWRIWWPVVREHLPIMSRSADVPRASDRLREQRSYAVEQLTEPPGTVAGNDVPDLAEQLSALDDMALLDILARMRDDTGDYRYAESRVAKFIPGRVEDNLARVRDVRGTEKPLPPGRVLRVRDQSGERVIPFR